MADLKIQRQDGTDAGSHALSERLAEATASSTTVHRAVVAEEANKRQGTQRTKSRSEVRGGGRKPYKQKKTGNARQGSIRAPHYAHGGTAMPIRPRDYEKKVNKKERRAAILTAFAEQVQAGNVSVVDTLTFAEPKTKDAMAMLAALGLADTRRVLIVLPQHDEVTLKCFRNLKNVTIRTAPSTAAAEEGAEATKSAGFSVRDVLVAHKIVIAQDALAKMEEVWAK